MIIPVNMDQTHWGAIFAVAKGPRKRNEGEVYWGDSLGVAPPPKFREAVKTFLQALPGDVGWTIRDEKYMTDVLNFEKQQDSYSCGFYVLGAAITFADDRGGMLAGNYVRYSAERTH